MFSGAYENFSEGQQGKKNESFWYYKKPHSARQGGSLKST